MSILSADDITQAEHYTKQTLVKRWLILMLYISSRHAKCHFLNIILILGKNNLPPKVRYFQQYQICNKAALATKYN